MRCNINLLKKITDTMQQTRTYRILLKLLNLSFYRIQEKTGSVRRNIRQFAK